MKVGLSEHRLAINDNVQVSNCEDIAGEFPVRFKRNIFENDIMNHNQNKLVQRPRTLEIITVFGFVVTQVFAPFVLGEVYPFTIAPMFRDQPSQYCVYEVLDPNGLPVDDLARFGLHLVYDGNPPGLGMGIEAKPTLHEFGEVVSREEIEQHVRDVLTQMDRAGERMFDYVTVKQKIVSGVNYKIHETENVWRIDFVVND